MKKWHKIISRCFLFLFLCILCLMLIHVRSWAQSGDAPQLFLEANQAYEKGDYQTAANLYEKILNNGIQSGMILYNLGNCYTRLGQTGKALLSYRRAERLIPRDSDLKFNLGYILDQRKDKIESKNRIPFARVFFFWYYWLSLKELLIVFIVAHCLLWLAAIILLFKPIALLRWVRILSLCLFLIFGASFGMKAYIQEAIDQGVVVVAEATVRSGNGPHHSALFVLHEGAEFSISEEARGCMKIRLADGKIGWIASTAIQII